ncbi:MAG: tRNA epoxyqueuosine(34) reductase QueG [Verrucomicrobiales bacterium]
MHADPAQNEEQKRLLQERALELGFALCRVASVQETPHYDAFLKWLNEGRHASMEWLVRGAEKRAHPERVLPGCQSVVVLATNYFRGTSPATKPGHGRVAQYAQGLDYHDVLKPRLRELENLLAEWGAESRAYTDTGPILERDFAALAGVGWHGKSTMLLHPQLGTWFFLSVILTTLRLPDDPPIRDRCGSCTRCMVACPTNAIPHAYQLDSRRCISYHTIENRGSIPVELRPAFGDRIFGCDACLDACPWNRFAEISREQAFRSKDILALPMVQLLQMSAEEFRVAFRGSPVLRTKHRGFLRNVLVAYGNTVRGDAAALTPFLSGEDPLLKEHAEWARQRMQERRAAALTSEAATP